MRFYFRKKMKMKKKEWKIIKFLKKPLEKIRSKKLKDMEKIKKYDEELKNVKLKQEKKSEKNIFLENKVILRFRLMWLLTVFIWFTVYKSLSVLYLIFTALIVSVAIEVIISFFEKKIKKRRIAIIISYLLMIIFVLSSFFIIIPFLLGQATIIIQSLIWCIKHLQEIIASKWIVGMISDITRLPVYIKSVILDSIWNPDILINIQTKLQSNISQIIWMWTKYASTVWNIAVNFLWSFFYFIWQLAIVLTLSILFSIWKKDVIWFISKLWWNKNVKYFSIKIEKIYKKLWLWLKWQLILCIFIFIAMLIALLVMSLFWFDIHNKLTLAVIAWLTEFIPYIWPLLWWLPAFLYVTLHNWILWWFVMILVIFLIQRLENNILVPFVMNKTLWVSPILIFLSILLWWIVLWFTWVILAIPIAIIISMFFEWEEDN